MPSVGSIILNHNSKILNENPVEPNEKQCSCPKAKPCPLFGKCLQKCIVYKAVVKTGDSDISYFGACEPTFKERFNNHNKSFNNRKYEKDSELSKYIWELKDSKKTYEIEWSIAATASPYACGSRRCDLCNTEKLMISMAEPQTLLNKRCKILSKCRHKNKYALKRSIT